ncbi:MAG: efflux RND transporter periplasmic adaptor subunit [Proteiniphilum sp.]|jgi:HlyD family secretion protein|nr:efflux RND transporter periplasmic adaptor subunit [Proteiniphilum sp.]NCB24379.1 HlyD family efflux transporter periplasmic adaptor subunit [Bacteroidia bacterium]MDD2938074.1 efflux RND transporter periplasmic adaptor subunit [Proteiniphilum sp.]MDD3075389.1 efflux RND transporter periplasmic adaptor subunit [Proteiniphilum sp.]MDD3778936.1 efflux RND transporter periplasmic adaptor subunit [Proteiniphilum sp.]
MKRSRLNSLFLAFLAITLLFSCKKSSEPEGGRKTSDGSVIVETGELAAVNSRSVVINRYGRQWYQMKIIGLLDHGEIVKKGDSIAQLDPADINKYILESESNLETQLAALEKLYVEQDNKKQERESRIKNETATFDLKKIELEASRFESERLRQIKQLEYEQAVINLEKEKRIYELNKTINSSELIIQEIRVEQIKKEIENAKKLIPLLTLRAPVSGVFQIATNSQNSNRNIYKIGDNIYAGNSLAIVPELEFMKVNTQVNETDFLKISLNQKVAVRLDAMPKIVFNGEVIYIGKLCRLKDQKSRQKVFDVEVKILKSDERLKPGMTVSCEFL